MKGRQPMDYIAPRRDTSFQAQAVGALRQLRYCGDAYPAGWRPARIDFWLGEDDYADDPGLPCVPRSTRP